MTRKLFAFALALFAAASTWAYDFKSGDLYYNITDEAARTVEVTGYATKPTGTLDIPATVSYYNISTYSVTSIGESAFEDCSALTQVSIGNGVTSIGNYAFHGCTALTAINVESGNTAYCSVDGILFNKDKTTLITYPAGKPETTYNIPNSVTSIGDWAFSGCDALMQITIPNSVTNIGQYAFQYCSALAQVTIGNSVTSIGKWAFYRCSKLTQVTIGNSVTSIGHYAFAGCSALTQVTWNAINCENFTYDNRPFKSCPITTFIFGDQVEHIPAYLCYGMDKLTQVTIPSSITSIGSNAFNGCSALTQVTWNAINCENFTYDNRPFKSCPITTFIFGEQVEHIPAYLCDDMDKLTQVTIPNSVTSIGDNAFYGCSALNAVYYTGDVAGWCGITFNTYKSNPLYTAHNLYINNNLVTELVIPEGVTSIGNYAFDNCSSIISATLPNSVTNIGVSAFYGCSSLASINIPEGVKSIGYQAFQYCSALTAVYYTGNVAGWCGITFDGSSSNPLSSAHNLYIGNTLVTNLVIPEGVTEIKAYAFDGCSALTQVTIPGSVTSIGDEAFDGCSALTQITWNAINCVDFDFTNYRYSPFYGIRSNITVFTFGDQVEHIPAYLCYGMDKLTQVTLPNSVTSIGDYAFSDCSALTQVTIGSGVTSIGNSAFSGCSALTQVTIPNSVTSIGDYAFSDCSALTQVTIGNSVTSIGNSAFSGCSALTQVTIPGSVTSIGGSAFSWCSALTQVTWNAINCADFSYDYNTYIYPPFFNCPVTDFTFGSQVEHIPAYLCYGMDKLTTVIISDNVTSIGAEAFSSSGVVSLAIPAKATEFGADAFMDCNKLATVFYRGNMAEWCNISFENNYANPLSCAPKTVNLHIDNKVIKELTIPEGITAISDYCFYNAAFLTSLDISSSITNIGESAFAGCTALDSIYCRASVPPTIMPTTFDGVDRSIPLYIPEGKIMDYMFAPYWNEFTNLHTMPATALQTPSMPESIRVYGGLLHNPQGLPVSIYDMQGRMVYSGTAATVSQPAGVYVLRCAGASRKVLF